MASSGYEGGTGGKYPKRLPRKAPSTPYDRPPSAVRGLRGTEPAAAPLGSRWLLNIVDPASRVIARSASRLFSSVFRRRLAAPPGESRNTIEDAPEALNSLQRPSTEVRDGDVDSFDARLSIPCDRSCRYEEESISGADDIFELEQLLKQKSFSRSETERLTELLHSRTIEPSSLPPADYKNKGKLYEDSNINPGLSQQAVDHGDDKKENTSEFQDRGKQLVTLHGNISSGANANIPAEGFGSPIEIARAYMGSISLKAAPSAIRLKQSQVHLRDKGSPLSSPFGNKQSNAVDASKSAGCFPVLPVDPVNNYTSPTLRGRSASYKLPHFPYCRSPTITNTREYSPYKGSYISPSESVEWTPSSSNISHFIRGQALKRGSSDNDVGSVGDVRRVRQKSSLKELHSSSSKDAPSTSFDGQGDSNEIYLKGLENVDDRLQSASVLSIPPQSTQMARKILHQLDKLAPSPRNSSSEKKVTFGDSTFSKSSLGALHEGSQKFRGDCSSTKIVNVPSLGEPSSSTLARVLNSTSPNKDKAKEVEGLPIRYISRAEATSSFFGMNSSVTSASGAKRSMRSSNSNSHGFPFLSTQKDPILQIASDDKDEPRKADHTVFSSVEEPREKSLVQSVEFAPTSRLINGEIGTKVSVLPSSEKDASFKFTAAPMSNALATLLSSTMATTTADGSTPVKGETVLTFKFGSTGSTASVLDPLNMGISASGHTGEALCDGQTVELDRGASVTNASQNDKSVSSTLFASPAISASSSNPCSKSAAPRFQFGSGNSTIYSFTGLSAASSSMGNVSSMCNGSSKFQFGTRNSSSYSFAGVASSSCQDVGVSSPIFSSLHPVAEGAGHLSTSSVLPISANGLFGVGTSPVSVASFFPFAGSSTENSPTNFGAPAASSSGTTATFSGNGIRNFSHSSVNQFGPSDSPVAFGLGSSFSTLSSTSTGYSFGMPANSSSSMPFGSSSGLIFPLVSTSSGSGCPSNDQMPMDSTSIQPSNPEAIRSGTQLLQFGSFQNNSAKNSSPFQESSNPGFSAGGSFSFGSGGTEKSDRKFIRVRRDKRRK